MSAKYTPADYDRAHSFANVDNGTVECTAQLIADVRAEERERCATIADNYYVSSVAGAIANQIRSGA